jgi:hypothetical protein
MKRAVLALPVLAALAAFVVPAALSASSSEVGVCELMTPARMLEHPGLAHELAQALRSGDAAEVARVRAMLREIRTAHGCEGEIALPEAPREEPALPPGHPPIDGRHAPSSAPFIEAPTTFNI